MNKLDVITQKHRELQEHSLYNEIKTLNDLKIFMRYHVFAVWDFMSLLKSLQREITCVSVPWRPSSYPKKVVRFINEIVLGEESDVDEKGEYNDHFSMYLEAMNEIGVSTEEIEALINEGNLNELPKEIKDFVSFNIDLGTSDLHHLTASAFFYGRENLIPDIFEPIVEVLEKENLNAKALNYYLKRHIELDGDEHGGLAKLLLEELCEDDQQLDQAYDTAIVSLEYRKKMWDYILQEIQNARLGHHPSL